MTTTLVDAPKKIAGGFGRSAPLTEDQIGVLALEHMFIELMPCPTPFVRSQAHLDPLRTTCSSFISRILEGPSMFGAPVNVSFELLKSSQEKGSP